MSSCSRWSARSRSAHRAPATRSSSTTSRSPARTTSTASTASRATLLAGIQAVEKTLLLDLDELGIPLDNVEGMTFGPDLPTDAPLVLVSDNNFSPAAFTQFLLFAAS